jgi:hypothetical protein
LVFSVSSHFAHVARSQEPKAEDRGFQNGVTEVPISQYLALGDYPLSILEEAERETLSYHPECRHIKKKERHDCLRR